MDDTHPQVRAMMTGMLAAVEPARRFAMTIDLTRSTIRWSRNAVRAAMPGAPEQDVMLRWVAVTYGPEIARRLRESGRTLGS